MAAVLAAAGVMACSGSDDGEDPQLVECLSTPELEGPTTFRPGWEVGDRFILRLTKERRRFDDEDEVQRVVGEAKVRVLEEDGRGWLLEWKPDHIPSPQIQFSQRERPASARLLEDIADDFALRYRATPKGLYAGLTNAPEVRALTERMVEVLAEQAGVEPTHPELASTRALLTSAPYIHFSLAEDIIQFHEPFGYELTPGKELELKTPIASPLSGDAIPAETTVSLVDSPKPPCVAIETVQRPEAERVQGAVDEIAASLSSDGEGFEPGEVEGMNIDVTAVNLFDVERGMPVRSNVIKHITVPNDDGGDQISTIEVVELADE